jgi:hypothetical protein
MDYLSDSSENSYELYNILRDFNIFHTCVNHREEHNDSWKSSMSLKIVISITPCNNS